MKKFLAGVVIAGLMLCGMAVAQAPFNQDPPKAEHKAKTADKAPASKAQSKATPDWWVSKGSKAKTEQPKQQKTSDKAMNKTDKQQDKAKAKKKGPTA